MMERKTYYPEEDPKNRIYNFLKENPKHAFTPEEIAVNLTLPFGIVNVDLLFLASHMEIQSVYGTDKEVHYQITKK